MNFVVLLFPLYLGCCQDGWLEILQKEPNSVEKCREYGRWVAARYKHFPNIIWVSGGDHNPTPESISFAEGISEVDTSHLHSYHGNPAFTSTELLPNTQWLTLGSIYTYFPAMNVGEYHVYGQIYNESLRNHRMPFFMAESAYEYERDETTQILRRQAYWSVLSGACGHIFGNRDTWMMNGNWPHALNTPGNKSMQIFNSFVKSFAWFDFEPDWTHTLFTEGRGQFNAGTAPGGEDYATGGMTKDHQLAVLYMPTHRTVCANMERFNGPVSSKWLDPTNGKYIPGIFGLKNQGVWYFTPPSFKNSQGFDDWVLLLESKKVK